MTLDHHLTQLEEEERAFIFKNARSQQAAIEKTCGAAIQAEKLCDQARRVVEFIADPIGDPKLRAPFLALSLTRVVTST